MANNIMDAREEYEMRMKEYRKELDENLEKIKKSAESGDNLSKLRLGEYYLLHRDYKKAMKWLQDAVENDIYAAADLLGDFYFYGWGIEKDKVKAHFWYNKAEEVKKKLLEKAHAEKNRKN